jgi:hypothetical protein
MILALLCAFGFGATAQTSPIVIPAPDTSSLGGQAFTFAERLPTLTHWMQVCTYPIFEVVGDSLVQKEPGDTLINKEVYSLKEWIANGDYHVMAQMGSYDSARMLHVRFARDTAGGIHLYFEAFEIGTPPTEIEGKKIRNGHHSLSVGGSAFITYEGGVVIYCGGDHSVTSEDLWPHGEWYNGDAREKPVRPVMARH